LFPNFLEYPCPDIQEKTAKFQPGLPQEKKNKEESERQNGKSDEQKRMISTCGCRRSKKRRCSVINEYPNYYVRQCNYKIGQIILPYFGDCGDSTVSTVPCFDYLR